MIFVCLLALLENHTAERHQIFLHVAYDYSSVLLRCDTLCTFDFVYKNVIFGHKIVIKLKLFYCYSSRACL